MPIIEVPSLNMPSQKNNLNRNNIRDSVWGYSAPASMRTCRLYQAHCPTRHMHTQPKPYHRHCVSALHRLADSLRDNTACHYIKLKIIPIAIGNSRNLL